MHFTSSRTLWFILRNFICCLVLLSSAGAWEQIAYFEGYVGDGDDQTVNFSFTMPGKGRLTYSLDNSDLAYDGASTGCNGEHIAVDVHSQNDEQNTGGFTLTVYWEYDD